MSLIPALWEAAKGGNEFKASLAYRASSRIDRDIENLDSKNLIFFFKVCLILGRSGKA